MVAIIFSEIIFYISLIILIQQTVSLSKYMKYCISDEYCQSESGLICKSSICVCATHYNSTSQRCEERRCTTQLDCFTNDKYSMCRNGRCVCNDRFVLSSNGKCNIRASVNKLCSYSIDCALNERCVDNTCRCDPDYHFDTFTNSCQYFNCVTSQINCSTPYDPHRECSPVRGSCICGLLTRPYRYNGNQCYYKTPVDTSNLGLLFRGLSNRNKSSYGGYSSTGEGVGSGNRRKESKRSDKSGEEESYEWVVYGVIFVAIISVLFIKFWAKKNNYYYRWGFTRTFVEDVHWRQNN